MERFPGHVVDVMGHTFISSSSHVKSTQRHLSLRLSPSVIRRELMTQLRRALRAPVDQTYVDICGVQAS